MNLTNLLLTPQNIDQLSQQFNISNDQAAEAISALLPAFSQGLKRNAQTGQQAAGFIQALASGRHARYIDNPAEAMTRKGREEGQAILGHLFKTPDVSRAVASHAASSTGLGATLLKKMLPVIASMVMGAIFKGATSGRGGGALGKTLGGAVGGGLLGTILEGLVSGGAQGMPTTRRKRSTGGIEDMIGDVLGGMLGGGASAPAPNRKAPRRRVPREAPAPSPQNGNVLGDLLDSFLGGGSGRSAPQANPRDPVMPPPRGRTTQQRVPRQPRQPRTRANDGFGDIFGELLEPGPSSSRDYQRKTRSVIDDLLGN